MQIKSLTYIPNAKTVFEKTALRASDETETYDETTLKTATIVAGILDATIIIIIGYALYRLLKG